MRAARARYLERKGHPPPIEVAPHLVTVRVCPSPSDGVLVFVHGVFEDLLQVVMTALSETLHHLHPSGGLH